VTVPVGIRAAGARTEKVIAAVGLVAVAVGLVAVAEGSTSVAGEVAAAAFAVL